VSAETAFKAAVLARLAADEAVKAVLGDPARAFDAAPGGAAFPWLACGRSRTEPFDADGAGLADHRLTLLIRARAEDREGLRAAVGAVREALHGANIEGGGWRAVVCRAVYADAFESGNGRTAGGVVRLRALLERDE
jgi:hypothetical protein